LTAEEAANIAGRKARELNMPWGPEVTVTRLWRLWPFPRMWRVVSRQPAEFSETTIVVNAQSREAFPRRVHVARRFGRKE
jgi:hypothetical protein